MPPCNGDGLDCAAGWKSQLASHTNASSDIPDETGGDERRARGPHGIFIGDAAMRSENNVASNDDLVSRRYEVVRRSTSTPCAPARRPDTFAASQVADGAGSGVEPCFEGD